jgi:hypothetical protein
MHEFAWELLGYKALSLILHCHFSSYNIIHSASKIQNAYDYDYRYVSGSAPCFSKRNEDHAMRCACFESTRHTDNEIALRCLQPRFRRRVYQ